MTIADVRVSAENPRYLAIDGEPVFLIGATYPAGWYPISRPDRDFRPELDRLADVIDSLDSPNVKGLVRVIPYFPGDPLQPWAATEETGTYDLDAFDPAWEQRLRDYLDAAAERDLVVSLELWDDWSITRGVGGAYDPGPEQAWNAHPFNPDNNVNYGTDVLSAATSSCDAPFYTTVPENPDTAPVLERQQRYARTYARIVADHPNVICNVSNESRADLGWSRYWAEYLRDHLDDDRLIGEMPSTNDDGTGQCDPDLSPPTLFADGRYDYVDCAQALSSHSFDDDIDALVTGTKERMQAYAEQMDATDSVKPAVVSKDYTNTAPTGRPVVWSKFLAGTASVRFHRHGVSVWDEESSEEDVAFVFEAIESLGRFVARTQFFKHSSTPEIISSAPDEAITIARSDPGQEYVIGVFRGHRGRLAVDLEPGTYTVAWYDPAREEFDEVDSSPVTVSSAGETVKRAIPDGSETQIFYARRT